MGSVSDELQTLEEDRGLVGKWNPEDEAAPIGKNKQEVVFTDDETTNALAAEETISHSRGQVQQVDGQNGNSPPPGATASERENAAIKKTTETNAAMKREHERTLAHGSEADRQEDRLETEGTKTPPDNPCACGFKHCGPNDPPCNDSPGQDQENHEPQVLDSDDAKQHDQEGGKGQAANGGITEDDVTPPSGDPCNVATESFDESDVDNEMMCSETGAKKCKYTPADPATGAPASCVSKTPEELAAEENAEVQQEEQTSHVEELPSETDHVCEAEDHPTQNEDGKPVYKVGCHMNARALAEKMAAEGQDPMTAVLKLECPCVKLTPEKGRPPRLSCKCQAVPENLVLDPDADTNPDNDWPDLGDGEGASSATADLGNQQAAQSRIPLALVLLASLLGPAASSLRGTKAVRNDTQVAPGLATRHAEARHRKLCDFL